jgi:hypothetical protein
MRRALKSGKRRKIRGVESRSGQGVRTIASGDGTILNGAVKVPVVVETRALIGRLRMKDEKLTDRLNAPSWEPSRRMILFVTKAGSSKGCNTTANGL